MGEKRRNQTIPNSENIVLQVAKVRGRGQDFHLLPMSRRRHRELGRVRHRLGLPTGITHRPPRLQRGKLDHGHPRRRAEQLKGRRVL